jgi:complement component 1 Q subcomponent-binding protein
MTLFAAATGRAATSSLPLLRASTATLLRPLAAAARPVPFSSAAAVRPSSDDELLRVIKSEINFAEDCDDQDRVAFSRILTAPPILVTCAAVSICPRFSSV